MAKRTGGLSIEDELLALPPSLRSDPFAKLNDEQKREFAIVVEHFKTSNHASYDNVAATLSNRWGIKITGHRLRRKLESLNVKH